MDLLFERYASPFLLLDNIITTARFCEFIETFRKQKEESDRWEYYIHKIPAWNEMTWDEFNQSLDGVNVDDIPRATNEQLETTVSESFKMLSDFKIDERKK